PSCKDLDLPLERRDLPLQRRDLLAMLCRRLPGGVDLAARLLAGQPRDFLAQEASDVGHAGSLVRDERFRRGPPDRGSGRSKVPLWLLRRAWASGLPVRRARHDGRDMRRARWRTMAPATKAIA